MYNPKNDLLVLHRQGHAQLVEEIRELAFAITGELHAARGRENPVSDQIEQFQNLLTEAKRNVPALEQLPSSAQQAAIRLTRAFVGV